MPYMKSLTSCLNKMMNDGYTENFKLTESGLESSTRQYNYKPEEIKVVNFFRFEGESDPGNNAIIYIIETTDGIKGTLVDSYGVNNDSRLSNFLQDVDLKKKLIKN